MTDYPDLILYDPLDDQLLVAEFSDGRYWADDGIGLPYLIRIKDDGYVEMTDFVILGYLD